MPRPFQPTDIVDGEMLRIRVWPYNRDDQRQPGPPKVATASVSEMPFVKRLGRRQLIVLDGIEFIHPANTDPRGRYLDQGDGDLVEILERNLSGEDNR